MELQKRANVEGMNILKEIQSRSDRSVNSQKAANAIDAVIAQLDKVDAKGNLPEEVFQYLRDNHIEITVSSVEKATAMNIDDYLKSIVHEDGKGLGKG